MSFSVEDLFKGNFRVSFWCNHIKISVSSISMTIQVSDHLDDEEEDEETQLESYTSAIDDEGVADEYIAFKNALHCKN